MSKVQEMREAFSGQFMQPQAYHGRDIQSEIMEAGLDLEDDGIYCRFSADGYLDCTDWAGPFDTMEDAADYLIRTYADY